MFHPASPAANVLSSRIDLKLTDIVGAAGSNVLTVDLIKAMASLSSTTSRALRINIDMRMIRLVVLGLLMLATNGIVHAHLPERFSDLFDVQFTRPQRVVEISLQAVDRGELIVFDTVLTRSILTP